MLHIEHESEFQGPNRFAGDAIVLARLRIAPGADSAADPDIAIREATGRMRAAFPEWLHAEPAGPDALLDAARAVAQWSLGALNDVRGFLHEAGAERDAEVVRLWVGVHQGAISRKALEIGAAALGRALQGPIERRDVQEPLDALFAQTRSQHPDFQARILMEGARAADIPALPFLRGTRFWQFGWGARSRFFLESASNADGYLGANIQRSKMQTKSLFARLGMPTPRSMLVSSPEELATAVERVGWPCVLKPEDRGGGRGVTANIRNMTDLQAAYRHARTFSSTPLLVETYIPGDDHRIMVLDGRVHAVSRRQASWVTGDGQRTIAELLAQLNSERSTNMVKSRYRRPIATDDVLKRHLEGQGYTTESVPPEGARVALRSNANLSTGGVCTDVTDRIHPSTRQFAEMFARTLGLGHMGLDYITPDIARPWQEGGGFIEANATPGLDAIIAAGHDPVKIALAVLGGKPGRIPLRIVLIADEELEVATSVLQAATVPYTAGWACHGHAQVGVTPLALPTPAMRPGAQALLLNQSVESVLLVCRRSELVRGGLPVDRADEIAVCFTGLEDDWMRVVGAHARRVTQHADWAAFAGSGPLFAQ